MEHRTWYRKSSSGEGDIFSRAYIVENPKGIFQIAHGMCEHAGRYEAFAKSLAEEGYIVCANDHLGHGESHLGCSGGFANKDGGFDYIIQDIHLLFEEMKAEFPGVPLILLGHSMGSILSALFAEEYSYLDQLILMGTPSQNKMSGFALWLLGRNVKKHGYTYESKLCNYIMWGAEAPTLERKRKSKAWLSYDSDNIEKFITDKKCTFSFNDSANLELVRGLAKWGEPTWGDKIGDIPILIIAGAEDKIGGNGKGPTYYYKKLSEKHTKVTLNLIKGNKHEVLNEINKKENGQYIIDWLNNKK
ncbi:MAG: alpha/beta fold hydrolase [Eubacteriales bacterium]